jgi:hypothetical protein
MIVKNESANLPICLASVAGLVDETIVVDTGSTDRTRETAAEYGARVVDFAWVDSFALARNESLRHATGDWILWLDADDRLDEANHALFQALAARLGNDPIAYFMGCRLTWETGMSHTVEHVRLFRNLPSIRWKYRVHEQLMYGDDWLTGSAQRSAVTIQHLGYHDPTMMQTKLMRNVRLLELDRGENPDDPAILFHLGWTYLRLARPAEALPVLQQSLIQSSLTLSIVGPLYTLIALALEQLGRKEDALAVCTEAGRRFGVSPDLMALQERLGGGAGSIVVRGW